MANEVQNQGPPNNLPVGANPNPVNTTQLEQSLHNHFQQRGFNLTGVNWPAAVAALEELIKALSPALSPSNATGPGAEVHKYGAHGT